MLDIPKMEPADVDAMLHTIAWNIDRAINGPVAFDAPRRNGFVVMLFPIEGHMGRCNYISNADRADIVALLKAQVANFEGWPDLCGHA